MGNCKSCGCHLRAGALGMALGLIWGLCILTLGLLVHFAYINTTVITVTGVYYLSYGPTILGSFVGGLIAFAHGFIKGVLIGWLYNLFAGCCGKCKTSHDIPVEVNEKQ